MKQTAPVKRQSFSIESLAVSSHVMEDTARDTGSPYLNYLQTTNATLDYNSNVATNTWTQNQNQCWDLSTSINDTNKERITSATDNRNVDTSDIGHLKHPTSTPKMASSKRRRLCSTSTPPSSSDDSNSEEHMVTDDSGMMAEGYGEHSPRSITSSSTTSGKYYTRLVSDYI